MFGFFDLFFESKCLGVKSLKLFLPIFIFLGTSGESRGMLLIDRTLVCSDLFFSPFTRFGGDLTLVN